MNSFSNFSETIGCSSNENVSANLEGSTLTLDPALNYNGTTIVTVTIAEIDGEYQTSESFDVTISPVNDAPEMVVISDVSTLEETSTTVLLNATDIDGDTDFSFSADSDSDIPGGAYWNFLYHLLLQHGLRQLHAEMQ